MMANAIGSDSQQFMVTGDGDRAPRVRERAARQSISAVSGEDARSHEGVWIGEAVRRRGIEPGAGDNVPPGWAANMIWITLNATELRDCRCRHVAQLTR